MSRLSRIDSLPAPAFTRPTADQAPAPDADPLARAVPRGTDPALASLIATMARGPAVNFGARAPVLRLLQSGAASSSPYTFIEDSCRDWPGDAVAIRTAWNRGSLASFFAEISEPGVIDFDQRLGLLHVASEPLRAALSRMDWAETERHLPYLNLSQDLPYDVALSYASEERAYVESLFTVLAQLGYAVFYDFNEQDRLLGAQVDNFLEAIFTRESRFVVVVLSNDFGRRRPHVFEAEIIQEKVPQERILPIYYRNRPCGPFDSLYHQGHLWLDSDGDLTPQVIQHAELISKKVAADVSAGPLGRR
ncbi:TIR domain-containing protein [Streptomyces avermitilis]